MNDFSPSLRVNEDYKLTADDRQRLLHTLDLLPQMLMTSSVSAAEKRGLSELSHHLDLSSILGNTEDHVIEFYHAFKTTLLSAIVDEEGGIIPPTYNALWSVLEGQRRQFIQAAQQTGLRLPKGFPEAVYDALAYRLLATASHSAQERSAVESMSRDNDRALRAHLGKASIATRSRDVSDTRGSIGDPRDTREKKAAQLHAIWRTQEITPKIQAWIGTLGPLLETHLREAHNSLLTEQKAEVSERAFAAAQHLYVNAMLKIAEKRPNLRSFEQQMELFEKTFAAALADTELCDGATSKMITMTCIDWRKQTVMMNLSDRVQAVWNDARAAGGTPGGKR